MFSLHFTDTSVWIYEYRKGIWQLMNKQPLAFKPVKSVFEFNDGDKKMHITINLPNGEKKLYKLDTLRYTLNFDKSIPVKDKEKYHYDYHYTVEGNKPLENSFKNYLLNKGINKKEVASFISTAVKGKWDYLRFYNDSCFIFSDYDGVYEYGNFDSTGINSQNTIFETEDKVNTTFKNPYYPYIIVTQGNKPMRVFPYIKKYPYIYNKKHAKNIFALGQDNKGRIWAGSYQNYLSIIEADKVIELHKQPHPFMNASLCYKGKMYFSAENETGSVVQYDPNGQMHTILPITAPNFHLYLSKKSNILYLANVDNTKTLWYANMEAVSKGKVNWQKLDTTTTHTLFRASSLTEDTLGRIWFGNPKNGFGVFNPANKKAAVYLMSRNETPIGFVSSITDSRGTVWMGSDKKGLWYYNDYTKEPNPQNIKSINHPLLNTTDRITAFTIYKDWLVIGCNNKVCLFNLDSFYQNHKTIVRYLNPQEASFSSFTEQNTMLVSNRDSTVWFSTSDMLYQWDIKTWLHLPVYKVKLNCYLQDVHQKISLNPFSLLSLKAGNNSFDILIEYLSPDCLPRYLCAALIKDGDSLVFNSPDLQGKYSYKNLAVGNYTFYIQIFEQDGTTTHYKYHLTVSRFFWQNWWFWVLISLVFCIPLILWLNTMRLRAIQQKQVSHLNVVTLSSQFRPHFILNALNAIGADLHDKPAAETIISRLGESINLIFKQAQLQQINHSLPDEWVLVQNVISIHKIMYIPTLEVIYNNQSFINENRNLRLPLGIIEIMVENALLHGLRNKKNPPYTLTIQFIDNKEYYNILIIDNGIGRKKAKELSSYKNHGVSTKNLDKILTILNKFNKNKIEIQIEDAFTEKEDYGTKVSILISKDYKYTY